MKKRVNNLNSHCIFITLKSLCLALLPGNLLALICADQRLALPEKRNIMFDFFHGLSKKLE